MDSALICLAGPFSDDRSLVDPSGQLVQGGADRGSQDVGGFGVRERGEGADGLDAEPVQLLLGNRADPPQSAHRQAVQQHPFLVAAHYADAVGLGQPRGDLGDLLSRPGANGCDQPGHVTNLGPQRLAIGRHVRRAGADELGRLTEGLVEGQLLQHGHDFSNRVQHATARHAVDHPAGR